MFFHIFLVVSSASYLLVSRCLSRLFKTHLHPFVFASLQAEKKKRGSNSIRKQIQQSKIQLQFQGKELAERKTSVSLADQVRRNQNYTFLLHQSHFLVLALFCSVLFVFRTATATLFFFFFFKFLLQVYLLVASSCTTTILYILGKILHGCHVYLL